MPHHVTQRGNRRQQTFFGEEAYQHYLELDGAILPRRAGRDLGILLDDQLCSPDRCPAVRREPASRHRRGTSRRYTRWINFREGWRGHLWQGRCAPFVMDEDHLLTAARCVELNPVRAGLVQAPSRYRWISAAAHLRGRDVVLVQVAPLLQMAPNWRRLLTSAIKVRSSGSLAGRLDPTTIREVGRALRPARAPVRHPEEDVATAVSKVYRRLRARAGRASSGSSRSWPTIR